MNARPTGHAMRPRQTPRPQPPRAFTLIELLIAMTLTLMLVYAIAQFYAYVGETVRDGRAQIEMGGQLRAAAQRLQQDLAEMTVRIGARSDSGAQQGCFEIVEGIASDIDPNGDLAVTGPNNLFSADVATDANNDLKPDGAMLGDCDDILVMTIRSQGEPFVGRQFTGMIGGIAQYAIIQSNVAEVIWFTSFKDVNGDGSWTWDSNANGVVDPADVPEPRYLVRRQLLIRPDLAVTVPAGVNPFHHNDISCHVVLDSTGVASGFAANSLGDLSQRENRMVHQNLVSPNFNGLRSAFGYMPNPLQVNLGNWSSCAIYSLDGIPQFAGEDKMLSNVLAFDVRVYDPYAVLRADDADITIAQGVLSPGDPGYAYATANNFPSYLDTPPNGIGLGAYVDLWYNRSYTNLPPAQRNLVLQNSAYSWAPQARNFPGGAIWDTWTMAYEKDGIPQSIILNTPFSQYPARPTADWMVDGLDNDSGGGVDDPGEAETRPPYPVYVGNNGVDDNFDGNVDDANENAYLNRAPTILRGIEVRIRMYEPGTRQTRQQTVATDFIPE